MKRRQFISKTALSSLAVLAGTNVVFGSNMPEGYEPLLNAENDPFKMFGLDNDMTVLNKRPWNIEAKAHLLNDRITPSKYMFIRNNGLIPEKIDADKWVLTIDGESAKTTKTYTLKDLKTKFKQHTYQLTLECGGNGRSEYNPPAKGNQWTIGAVQCAEWTGVRLKDLLADVGVKGDAVYVAYHSADMHLSRDPKKEAISRGVPVAKAMEDEALIAFKMNGEDIPLAHGYPLRMVNGGWPASASGKWLKRISIRNIVHDGKKMGGHAYRMPKHPVAPGTKVKEEDMAIIESMPVKSLITYPKSGATLKEGQTLKINGHAWAGDLQVSKMQVSIDFGATWQTCKLEKPVNRLAWQHFSADIKFPKKGYYEIWAKATDSKGKSQPMLVPGWNPKGYLNNACHRIAVKIK